jgi:hypothetical protein
MKNFVKLLSMAGWTTSNLACHIEGVTSKLILHFML